MAKAGGLYVQIGHFDQLRMVIHGDEGLTVWLTDGVDAGNLLSGELMSRTGILTANPVPGDNAIYRQLSLLEKV